MLDACRELGVGFVPFSPLGRGFLSGKVRSLEFLGEDDFRRSIPRFEPENFRRNLQLVESVEEIASAKGCTPAQLALAWVLAQGEHIVPIPGTKRRPNLEENVGAVGVKLSAQDLRRVDEALPRGAVAGARYAAEGMASVNR